MLTLEGRHCIIRCESLQSFKTFDKVYIRVFWDTVGNDSPTATDRERIARFISTLPDFFRVLEEKITIDTLQAWIVAKDAAVQIARCFLAGRSQPDNPLLRDLEDGLIDQYLHDYWWLESDLYENLWKLVSLRERKIKAVLAKIWGYPFTSSRDLMQQIIQEDLEGEFCQIFKPRYSYKSSEIQKIAKLKRKLHRNELSDTEQKQMWHLIDRHAPYPMWCDRVVSVCKSSVVRGDTFIQTRMRIHGEIIDGLCKMQIRAECTPSLRHHRPRSHTWENCKQTAGITPGWKS